MSIDQLLAAMDEVLEQGEALLTGLSDAQYAHIVPQGGSIGAHYRHSLEHFQILFAAVMDSHIDYDRRARDARLESERVAALKATRDFRQAARFSRRFRPGGRSKRAAGFLMHRRGRVPHPPPSAVRSCMRSAMPFITMP
jgi:hypothetical protein